MDDRSPDTIDVSLPFPGPQRLASEPSGMPPGFVPLRLVLLPSGVTLELDLPDMVLGRHSDADLRLPMPDVSRHHCRFVWAAGTWSVVDMNSLNGIDVNGTCVQRSKLVQNDLVRIGGFTFSVDLNYPDPPNVVSPSTSRLTSVINAMQQASRITIRRKAS